MTRTRNPKGLIVKIFCPRILRLLNQRRQLEGMKDKWWKKNENRKVKPSQKQNSCEVTFSSQICDNEKTGAFGIENVGGVFIIIGIGIFLAVMLLGGEYHYYKAAWSTQILR